MEFVSFQECRSTEGWQPVKVESSREDGTFYVVLVNPWGTTNENICECRGYVYRGNCRHQHEASQKLCRWSDADGPEVQTEEQERNNVCPRCHKATRTRLEPAPKKS